MSQPIGKPFGACVAEPRTMWEASADTLTHVARLAAEGQAALKDRNSNAAERCILKIQWEMECLIKALGIS